MIQQNICRICYGKVKLRELFMAVVPTFIQPLTPVLGQYIMSGKNLTTL